MPRALLVAVSLLLLAAGCTHTESPQTAAPRPASTATSSGSVDTLPPPLLSNPSERRINSDGTGIDCPQQCERDHNVCMDSQSARSDVTSGTMFENRMFGPAARCEDSMRSCMKRCSVAASAPKK